MDEKSSKGQLALERNLQKAYKSVKTCYSSIQPVLKESVPVVTSVANLLEQLECCKSFNCSSLQFITDAFPDVKARLIIKLEAEITAKLEELESMIDVLRDKQEVVSKYCDSSASLVQKYSSSLDFSTLSSASPTTPSLADMVEWLENLDTLLHEQYFIKLHLVETVMTQEGVNSQNLVSMWTDQDDALLHTMKDYLMRVELFLEEKR